MGTAKKRFSIGILGTGPGSDWEILSQSYQVTGSDYSRAFINRLKTIFPKGKFFELDAVTLKIQLKFDGIYSNKVLHHLNNTDLSLSAKRQSEILNSNGIICHSFWKGEGSEVFKGLFLNYHLPSDIKDCFQPYFEIISITEYKEFEPSDSFLVLAKKK
ncbi:MAG: trans-aconitate 2-methyltransferase [Crocinitomicaceae bacterium]